MKKGMQKIVVPTLAICLGAALAGSISGTVAWYQYSTRASVAYLGTTAGTAGNLKLRIKGTNDWHNSLTKETIQGYLATNHIGEEIIPITAGNINEDAALNKIGGTGADKDLPKFYKNPVRSFDESVPYDGGTWLKADKSMYVQIPLELAFIEYDGVKSANAEVDKEYLEKEVFISDLLIQEDYQNTTGNNNYKDLSSAVRVHISSYRDDDADQENHSNTAFDRLISKDGGTILTEGYLDLDGDNVLDTVTTGTDAGAAYGFGQNNQVKKVVYGEGKQTAYAAAKDVADGSYKELDDTVVNEKIYPSVVKSVGNSLVLDENDFEFTKEGAQDATSKSIGKTIGYDADAANFEQEYLNVVLTIWLEGWQPLVNAEDDPATDNIDESDISPIWESSSFIGSMFDVGITFAVQAE